MVFMHAFLSLYNYFLVHLLLLLLFGVWKEIKIQTLTKVLSRELG